MAIFFSGKSGRKNRKSLDEAKHHVIMAIIGRSLQENVKNTVFFTRFILLLLLSFNSAC